MLLSELIKSLELFRNKHGDIETVFMFNDKCDFIEGNFGSIEIEIDADDKLVATIFVE
jgi:hypothetical protein